MTMSLGPNLGLLVDGAIGEQHFANLMAQFRGIDGLVQCHVKDKDLATPPASPANGDMYIVAASPTGAWVGQAGKLARYYVIPANGSNGASGTSGWQFFTPQKGWVVRVEDEADANGACKRYGYTGSAWVEEAGGGGGGGGGMTNPMTTAGDIITGGAAGAAQRLAAGVNGQRLTMVSGAPAWAYDLGATITESTTARNAALTDVGNYLRHTNASASTLTIPPQSSVAWPADAEIHVRRAAAGNLTLTPGSGVTLNAPSGGTLVLTNNMTVTLKRVASNVWDVIGQTVAA